jgi:hypothetical protein
MAKVYRSIGGAGTGKTRFILDSLSQAKREMGLGTHQIGFATFTRAGRAEIASRAAEAWDVDSEALTKDGWFRTAHSIAHRCCKVAEGQLIQGADGDGWMSRTMGVKLSGRTGPRGERSYSAVEASGGDPVVMLSLKAWDLARSKMASVNAVLARWEECGEPMPSVVEARRLIEKYESAKNRSGMLDYTDMIARFAGVRFTVDGPRDVEPEGEDPEGLRVLAIDEAQDSSTLVDRVCRRLAASPSVERIWLCGDPYQSIHAFAGGDYRHFMSWDAEESTMPRSYRCPPAVLALGEACLRQMSSGYRNRGIAAAERSGTVSRAGCIDEAVSRLRADSSTLILARCGYALAEYEEALIRKSLPYSWIEKSGPSSSLSGYGALWGLQHGKVITGEAWAHAIKMIAVKHAELGELIARGEKSAWAAGKRSNIDLIMPTDDDYRMIGATPVLQKVIQSGDWHTVMDKTHKDRAEAWIDVAKKHGEEIASNPKIRLSTIHGAKGLEADTVILSSATSPSVERGRMAMPDIHDEECRIAYVAVTRAKRDFVFVEEGHKYRMELPL